MAALTTEEVLRDEANAIYGKDLSGKSGRELYRALNELNSAALCLSGGGIRSAAFALGVIQALASHPRSATGEPVKKAEDSLLAKFHYLSTVSGGGYIGSWLSAWVARAREGFPAVWSSLIGRPDGPDIEPPVIGWLRSYSNFLTPKLGIMSADSWAAVAIVLRNLILNWIVILPALCVVLLLLKLLAVTIAWIGIFPADQCWPVPILLANNPFVPLAAAGFACLVIALGFRTWNRPTRGLSRATQSHFLFLDLLAAVLSALLLAFALALPCGHVYARELLLPAGLSLFGFVEIAVAGAATYAVAWIATAALRWKYLRKDSGRDLIAWTVAGVIHGALVAVGIYLYCQYYGVGFWVFKTSEILLLVLAVPWALGAQLIAEMIFVGLTSYQQNSDADREWLGRASGWFILAALAWLVLMFLVFVGLELTDQLFDKFKNWLGPAGGISGLITALLGKSKLSPAKGEATRWTSISINVVLAIAAPIFVVTLVITVSALLDQILLGRSVIELMSGPIALKDPPSWLDGAKYLLVGLAIALFVGVVASRYANINRFSLHALYRNRLIRAFLGASHASERAPNPFTDFDEKDNLRIHEIWPPREWWTEMRGRGWQPFHVINIALNVVSTDRLAWQERRAEPFTVSPLHSGSACVRTRNADGTWRDGAFRPSAEYGGGDGISLGTAMAISGAAASPNMGYHSSSALALLLTLFNVRLGWWLGNPRQEDKDIYGGEGPPHAIAALLNEMFGQTTDDSDYIYLSDGGHFENLGLYEMVRRRCRFIVMSDAGCDPGFAFADLGNAVRKIEIDLGVPIRFFELAKLKARSAGSVEIGIGPPYHAFGVIDYPTADGGGEKGFILYVKAGYHGIESAGVRAYALANQVFPHESTADQFFSESQFESYRSLGFEIVDGILIRALKRLDPPGDHSLTTIFATLEKLEV